MTASSNGDEEDVLQPRQQSLMRSSLLMASGTLVSRILGFLRNAMLIAAIGVSLGAADAFGAANTLPNNVYNLLAAGVFDAVLIPQIVRALRRKDGSVYVNRLLTAAGTILFALTVVAMVGAPLLISITSSGFPPEVRSLAIAFAIWCLPQIFFYGLYNLWGEVLNARGIFGPYMWAPVVNNVVSITGLSVFLYLWGPSGEVFEAHNFTNEQMIILAGSATLGVILQALVLLIPLRNSGVSLKLDFRFRESNFGSASKVAGWTFATLMVSQLGVLSTTNIASQAVRWGVENDEVIATLPAYNTAFMLYMVPQSLIAVTLATALFTRLANNVADGDYQGIAYNYHKGVRLIVILSMLAVSIMMVGAVPIMQIIMPHFQPEAASLYASVLVALVMAIPSTGIILVSQRVFFAFENAKPVFLMGIFPTALQIAVGWSFFFLADGQWWTVGAALGETTCRIVQAFIAIVWTAHYVRTINAGRVVADYLLGLTAFATSALVGWGFLHLISPISSADSSSGRFFDSLWRIIVVSIIVTIVFFLTLRTIDSSGSKAITQFFYSRLPARFRPPTDGTEQDAEPEYEAEEDVLTRQLPLGDFLTFKKRHPQKPDGEAIAGGVIPDEETLYPPTPSIGEMISGEYASHSLERPLHNTDPANVGQIPLMVGHLDALERERDRKDPMSTESSQRKDLPPKDLPDFDAVIAGGDPDNLDTDAGQVIFPAIPPPPEDTTQASRTPFVGSSGYDSGMNESAEGFPEAEPTKPESIPSSEPARGTDHEPSAVNPEPSGNGAKTSRFDPAPYTLMVGVAFVLVGLVFAVLTLRSPDGSIFSLEGLGFQGSQSETTGEDNGDESGGDSAGEATQIVAPTIASVEVFSWGDDGKDHPELVGTLTDGDPNSLWYTRYYDYNVFNDEDMISFLINLDHEAVVTEVVLDVIGSGGEVAIRAAEPGNPRAGTILTTSTLDGQTTITLPEPTPLSAIGLNFITLPMDDEGLYRAKVTGLSVR